MVKVIMHGCSGKMGHVVADIVNSDPDCVMAAGVDVAKAEDIDFDFYTSVGECETCGDVVIDFSTAKAVDKLLEDCAAKKLPLVLCTTGLSEEQLAKVEETSKVIPVLRSANMSLGINLLSKLLKQAAQVLSPAGFDIEIVERHHNRKVDAPSGTALMLADAAKEGLDYDVEYNYGRHERRMARPKNEIGISAVRGGTIVGVHEVIFAGRDEVIEIRHEAQSREIFASGAVKAAKVLTTVTAPGLYNMQQLVAAQNEGGSL